MLLLLKSIISSCPKILCIASISLSVWPFRLLQGHLIVPMGLAHLTIGPDPRWFHGLSFPVFLFGLSQRFMIFHFCNNKRAQYSQAERKRRRSRCSHTGYPGVPRNTIILLTAATVFAVASQSGVRSPRYIARLAVSLVQPCDPPLPQL